MLNAASMKPLEDDRLGFSFTFMVVLLALMLGGVFPAAVVLFSPTVVWLIWGVWWILIVDMARRIPILPLLKSLRPLFLWMLAYIVWGTMAATYPIFEESYRLAFRFGSVAIALAFMTASPRALNLFANAAQWVLLLNVIAIILLAIFPQYQSLSIFTTLNVEIDSDRFSGLWLNANQAGLVTLIILSFSHWATRWIKIMGRICGGVIIFLTASRTANFITLGLIVLFILFKASRKVQFRAAMVAATLIVGASFYVQFSSLDVVSLASKSEILMRVTDLSESKARANGDGSRVDLAKSWIPIIAAEPWYGYGLYTMNGGRSHEAGVRPGFPEHGPHNLYLGIIVDVGYLGLISFLLIVAWQLFRTFQAPIDPAAQWWLFVLPFVTLIFSVANHNMVTDYPGWTAFSMIFLLPFNPAVRLGNPASSPEIAERD